MATLNPFRKAWWTKPRTRLVLLLVVLGVLTPPYGSPAFMAGQLIGVILAAAILVAAGVTVKTIILRAVTRLRAGGQQPETGP